MEMAATHSVGQGGDLGIHACRSLQVSIVWNHYLLVFRQVAVQLQHVCAKIHSTAQTKKQYTHCGHWGLVTNGDNKR